MRMVGPLSGALTVVARSEDIAMFPPDALRQQQKQISPVLDGCGRIWGTMPRRKHWDVAAATL